MATYALPAGWSLLAARPREELHQALLTSTGERSFGDVPIDLWDGSAEVWRPTSIVRLLGGVWDVGRDVEVLIPDAGSSAMARVGIARVRLSRLLTAGVSRYWVARYQKLDLPVYWAGINAALTPHYGDKGVVASVDISYPRDFEKQQLGYAAMYGQP